MKKILLILANKLGYLLKNTYKYKDDSYPNWRYIYFFFYQRVLLFNFWIPWPVHYTSFISNRNGISFGKKCSPGISPFQYWNGLNGIKIGNNVQIAPGVQIISANHDFNDFDKSLPGKPIIIGSNVWIGANSVILPEVNIGDNVIIGAGSIVTKNIPSNSIAVGNPCKVISEKNEYKGK